jgi:hypothetical protein
VAITHTAAPRLEPPRTARVRKVRGGSIRAAAGTASTTG